MEVSRYDNGKICGQTSKEGGRGVVSHLACLIDEYMGELQVAEEGGTLAGFVGLVVGSIVSTAQYARSTASHDQDAFAGNH